MLEFIGDTLTVAGDVIIAYMILVVHERVREEHKVDEAVFRAIKREQSLVALGIILVIGGYALRIFAKYL
jgi:hypothetical protein